MRRRRARELGHVTCLCDTDTGTHERTHVRTHAQCPRARSRDVLFIPCSLIHSFAMPALPPHAFLSLPHSRPPSLSPSRPLSFCFPSPPLQSPPVQLTPDWRTAKPFTVASLPEQDPQRPCRDQRAKRQVGCEHLFMFIFIFICIFIKTFQVSPCLSSSCKGV